jgi:hypothetical protein
MNNSHYMGKKSMILLLTLIHLGWSLKAQIQTSDCNSYIIDHVNIIPMDKEIVLKNKTIIISRGKIENIINSSAVNQVRNACRIDGTGKYLIPGLTDMHAHFFYEQGVDKKTLPYETEMMLANGLTTVRIMCGCPLYQTVQRRIARGEIKGPELFVVSPQFVGQWPWTSDSISPKQIVQNPQEAAAAVRRFKKEGYDAIKITFFIKKPEYNAIIQTAAEENIKVTGHIGHDVKLPAALEAKQQIEHLDEFIEMLLPDSMVNKICVSGTDIWDKNAWEKVDLLDDSKIPALASMVKNAGVFISPTNYFFKANFGVGQTDEEIRNSVSYDFIPRSLLPQRASNRNYYWQEIGISQDRRMKWFGMRNKIINALYNAGVPLLCGSDSPEWYMVQGFSVHDELQAMVEAGLSSFAALQTSTVNPAAWLEISSRKGTIEVGKDADIVMLDANPLEDISNTRKIHAMFRLGKYYSRQELDRILRSVKAVIKEN